MPESALPPPIHRDLFDAMTFCLPPGEQFLGYPVAGPDNDLRPGRRRYNIVWYRPADESERASAAPYRRKRHHPLRLDSASAYPRATPLPECAPRPSDCLAPQLRADRAPDRRAAAATDLRSRQPASCFRPRRPHRRCGLRGAPACRRQGSPKRPTTRRRSQQRSRATKSKTLPLSRRSACRRTTVSSNARATSAPICRRRKARRSATRSARHGIPEAVLAETAVLDFLDA